MEPANLRRFFMNSGYNNANARELTEVIQWGNVPWQSMETAFSGCPNLKLTATDVPNLSGVKSLKQMFWFCRSFTPPFNIGLWDVRGVTDMESMFAETGSFNGDLSAWNLNALSNAGAMFSNSGISCEIYSRTLKAWATNPNTANNVNFSFQRNAIYANTAASFRNTLVNKGWSISMDGQAVPGSSCYNMTLPVTFGNIKALLKSNSLEVSWTTLTETNNKYFEIEVSTDGSYFTSIGKVLSKAQAGNSAIPLNYSFGKNWNGTIMAAFIAILLAGGMGLNADRKKYHLLMLAAACMGLGIAGCTKNNVTQEDGINNLHVRMKQVDKDGTSRYSKVVTVLRE
jgi:hypothetical protein